MAKNRKANDALWMAILQMLQGGDQNESVAVAAAAMSDIKRDGTNQEDIDNIVANSLFAQNNDPLTFIKNIFAQHPEMLEELDEFVESMGLVINTVEDLYKVILLFLKEVRGYGKGGQFETPDEGWIDVIINDKTYHLLHLVTEEQKELGLSNVQSMEDNEGALFDYSDEPQASLDFWMHETSIPLSICFINEAGKVISVQEGIPETDDLISESSEFIAYVIEVNSGENINAGDQTSLGQKTTEMEPGKLYMLDENGEPQKTLVGGERIFSRISTKRILELVERATASGEDKDYKALGRYVFKEMAAQDNREPEYVNN